MRALTIAFLILVSLVARPARAALVNGSFEPENPSFAYQALPGGSTAIPGWTTTDTGAEWFQAQVYGAPAPDGQYVVDIANYVYSAGGVQQTFATQAGAVHVVTFMLGTSQSFGRDGTCEIVVAADAVTETFAAVNHGNLAVYTPCTFTFVADDASATLSLRCLQNANLHFAYIDAVTLNPTTTGIPDTGDGDLVESTWGTLKALFR